MRPTVADACENGVVIRIDPRTGAVSDAEKLVTTGDADAAVKRVLSADRSFATSKVGATRLGDRALLVLALAVTRSDGRLSVTTPKGVGSDTSPRDENLAWAAGITSELSLKRSDEPALASANGEVLARIPARQLDARKMLAALEKKDIVATPYAYAALAKLRGERASDANPLVGAPLRTIETARREIELSRCRAMTKTPEICTASS